jgi:Zn-dependent M28 family amino/carboxypeptidase
MLGSIGAKILFIHREAADEMLKASGKSLTELQDSIDRYLEPYSFAVPGTKVNLYTRFDNKEKAVPNVMGLIRGNDPELQQEAIVYTAHFDHMGINSNGEVYNGADDNASGTVALIEIGEAFIKLQKDLKRSVLILWLSGEEIGLFGSRFYTEQPLIPLDQTVANINLDMVGAVRTARDTGLIYNEKVSVLGMDSISVIGGHQSAELLEIHNRSTKKMRLASDFSMNSPNHPYRYYYRSDHYHFAKNNIPVLFYSTGIHVDYHKPTDNYERINYAKLEKVSELAFLVGYRLATRKERITVDNPFSAW